MRIIYSLCVFVGLLTFPYKDVSAFPTGGVFKICNLAAFGCLAPGSDDIITLSWHPATEPLGANVTWEAFYAGHSGGHAYYFIANIHTGKCLDVVDGAYHDGAQLKVNPCSAVSTSQWWRVQTYGVFGTTNIRNLPSGKCITVPLKSYNTWSGAPPVQFSCGNKNQHNQYFSYDVYP